VTRFLKPTYAIWAAALLAAACIAGAALILFSGKANPTNAPSWRLIQHWQAAHDYYNADGLIFAEIYDLLIAGEIRTWQLNHAHYIFPDLLLYTLLRLPIQDVYLTIYAYGLTLYALMLLGYALLVWRLFQRAIWVILGILIGGLAPVVMLMYGPSGFYLFMQNFHMGLMLALPWVILLTLAVLRAFDTHAAGRYGLAALLALIYLLTSLSDWFFVPQIALPIAVALGVLVLCSQLKPRMAALVLAMMGVGMWGGRVLYIQITPPDKLGGFTDVTSAKVFSTLEYVLAAIPATFADSPVLASIWAVFFLGVAGYLLWFIQRAIVARESITGAHRDGLLVLVTLWASALGSLAFIIVFGLNNMGDVATRSPVTIRWFHYVDRYLLPTMFLPTFYGWPFLVGLLSLDKWLNRPRLWQWMVGGVFVFTLGVSVLFWREILTYGKFERYTPAYLPCLEQGLSERGLRYGVAGYWYARPITYLSRSGLQVSYVSDRLDVPRWFNSTLDYNYPFEFVIARLNETQIPGAPSPATVIAWFGEPQGLFACGDLLVMIYPPDSPAWQSIREPVFLVDFSQAGTSYTWGGASLRYSQGEAVNRTRTVAAGTGSAGNLTFGPYIMLPAGTYHFTLDYQAQAERQAVVGRWDVIYWRDDLPNDLLRGQLTTDQRQINGSFTLPVAANVEVRTFYENTGSLTIEALTLTRGDS